jgi:hypothetical protein
MVAESDHLTYLNVYQQWKRNGYETHNGKEWMKKYREIDK